MFLAITFAALFIIALLAYTVVAVRNIWKEQNDATAAFYAEALPVLETTRDNLKASNDKFEGELRTWYADHDMEFPNAL